MLNSKLLLFIILTTISIFFIINTQTDLNKQQKEIDSIKPIVSHSTHNTLSEGACQGCHGSSWDKIALSKSRVVSTLSAEEIATALIGYKNKTYGSDLRDLMHAQVARYSDDELREFAYTLSRKFTLVDDRLEGIVTIEERSYLSLGACRGCHGSSWQKAALGESLIVSRMSYEEIKEALIGYKYSTYGRDKKELMRAQVANYSDEELEKMARSISR